MEIGGIHLEYKAGGKSGEFYNPGPGKGMGRTMRDEWGRTIEYMRISITDRCNLRCKYCMPDGVEAVPRWDILSLEENFGSGLLRRPAWGVRFLKVTGGEPLVRRDCCQLVAALKAVPGIEKVTLTTNGVLLGQYLEDLQRGGD